METPATFDPTSIPPIGWAISSTTSSSTPEPKKPDIKLLDNAPNDVTFGGFLAKILIGGVVWGLISALLFAILSAVGSMIGWESWAPSAILGILLAVIGFIAGMLGNIGLAFLYSLFFSKRYYSLWKMSWLIFSSSIIIFIFCLPLYFLFTGGVSTMFTILGFQILFSFYVTSNLIEFLAHPNYSASSLMGNTLGFVLSVVVYLALVSGIQEQEVTNQIFLFMLMPTVIWYPIIIMGLGIWDAIYYKFFEWGNNPFYLRSLTELSKERQEEVISAEKEKEEVNVEIG